MEIGTEVRTPVPPAAVAARPARQRGTALVVVLWVIGLLSLLVVSFAFEMHLESIVTSYCRKRLKAEYLARSGIEIVKIIERNSRKIQGKADADGDEAQKEWYGPARSFRNNGAVHLEKALGEGTIQLDITPEPARRNVNKLDTRDWEGILTVGNVPEERWDELIDCFNDWVDTETPDTVRPYGAESDTYLQLTPAYKARNGALETVEELLRIKGFTREVLYGGLAPGDDEDAEPMSGIEDLLTTYGDDGKVNVNAASTRILMTLPGMDDLMADYIIEQREGLTEQGAIEEDTHFKDWNDFAARIPDASAELKDKVSFSSAIYRINSVGSVHGVKRMISCIAKFDGGRMTILRWSEQDGD